MPRENSSFTGVARESVSEEVDFGAEVENASALKMRWKSRIAELRKD